MLSPLYVISDRHALPSGRSLAEACRLAFAGGARLLQLRDKDLDPRTRCHLTAAVVQAARPYGATVLVNRDLGCALEAGAHGLHIGAAEIDDIPSIRQAFDGPCVIGVSTHTLEEARLAEEMGADFVTLGPVYATPSKAGMGEPLGPALVARGARERGIPVYALGGVDETRLPELGANGLSHVALIRAVMSAADPQAAASRLLKSLGA